MARYGMIIDTRKCVGCFACRTACQRKNQLLPDESFIRFEFREMGTFPNVHIENVPLQCMHCSDAPCVSVCPTGAACYGTDGVVQVDHGRCIGCLYCMAACPYQVRVRNSETGGVDKCRFCAITEYQTGENQHTCVSACPTGVRTFGDLDDPDSEISKKLVDEGGAPIVSGLTDVNVFYVR